MQNQFTKIKKWIKRSLGITALEQRIKWLEKQNEAIKDRLDLVHRHVERVNDDNRLVLNHIRFINTHFSVVADINPSGYEPSVVIVFMRNGQETVKSYCFENHTTEHIYRILEGFGKENVRVDKPRGFPRPRWRY